MIKFKKDLKIKGWSPKFSRFKILFKIQDPLDFAYCIVTTPPPPTINFSSTSRGLTPKCYIFLETSHDPWLRSQLNFFSVLFWKPTKFTLPEVLAPLRKILIIKNFDLENFVKSSPILKFPEEPLSYDNLFHGEDNWSFGLTMHYSWCRLPSSCKILWHHHLF